MSRSGSKVSMTQFTEKFFIHSLKYDYQMASDEMKFLIDRNKYNLRKFLESKLMKESGEIE